MAPLDLENGEDDKPEPKKPRGRPPKAAQTADLEKEMKEQLEELAAWIRARDPELAETLLEDVPRMAKFLAIRAGKHETLSRALLVVFAKDGPLAGMRAFGRTARTIAARIGDRRAHEDDEWPKQSEADGNWYDRDGNIVVPGT